MTESQPDNVGGTDPTRIYNGDPLAVALVALQADLPTIAKGQSATVKTDKGQYSYKYAGLVAVAQAIHPKLAEHGLAFIGFPTLNDAGRFVLRYTLLHTSGASRSGDFPLANDYKTPQALGSAITYARRYALCAVTGVAPEDDDGQAAAYQEEQNTAETPVDNERLQAIGAVQGVWQVQFGPWTEEAAQEAGAAYSKWPGSRGAAIRDASPAQLRAFAAYLSALPANDAGGPPPTGPANEPTDTDTRPMTGRQRGMLFALMGQLGKDDKGSQLSWINKTLGTEYESRSDITAGDAKILIDALQQGVDVPQDGAR